MRYITTTNQVKKYDFIVVQGKKKIAIEVKYKERIEKNGLDFFETSPFQKKYLLRRLVIFNKYESYGLVERLFFTVGSCSLSRRSSSFSCCIIFFDDGSECSFVEEVLRGGIGMIVYCFPLMMMVLWFSVQRGNSCDRFISSKGRSVRVRISSRSFQNVTITSI